MNDEKCIEYLKSISMLFEAGSKNCEGEALKIQQDYILAVKYAINVIEKNAKNNNTE